MTNAFDRLGTICLIFTALLVLPFLYVVRGAFMMVALFAIAAFPLCWIAGLNSLEFLTRPFNEKGVKGALAWIITIVLAIIVYAILGGCLFFIMRLLQVM